MDVRKAILKVSLFFLPLAAIWMYMEYRLSRIPNTYSGKRIALEHQLDSVQVLALGTSHILHGLNPEFLSYHCFNLANAGQTIFYDKRLAQKYLDRMPHLKLVLIEICYFSMYRQIKNDTHENWRDFFYSRFWGIDYKDLDVADMRKYSYVALYTPEKVRMLARKNFDTSLAGNLRYNGFMPHDTIAASDTFILSPASALQRITILNRSLDSSQHDYIYNDLKAFLSELQRRKIKVAFVSTPWTHVFIAAARPEIFQKNTADVAALCAAYHCPYYNYLEDARFSDHDFHDPNHLNYLGAGKFTRIVDSEIVVPLMKGG